MLSPPLLYFFPQFVPLFIISSFLPSTHHLLFASSIPVSDLSEPIDVYSEWIDLCEELNRRHLESGIGGGAAAVMGVSNRPAPGLAIPGLPGDGSAADGMMMMNFDAQQERDSDLDDFVVDDLAHLDSDLEDEKSGAEGGRGKEGRNGDVKREPGVEVTQEGQVCFLLDSLLLLFFLLFLLFDDFFFTLMIFCY